MCTAVTEPDLNNVSVNGVTLGTDVKETVLVDVPIVTTFPKIEDVTVRVVVVVLVKIVLVVEYDVTVKVDKAKVNLVIDEGLIVWVVMGVVEVIVLVELGPPVTVVTVVAEKKKVLVLDVVVLVVSSTLVSRVLIDVKIVKKSLVVTVITVVVSKKVISVRVELVKLLSVTVLVLVEMDTESRLVVYVDVTVTDENDVNVSRATMDLQTVARVTTTSVSVV